LVHGLEDGLIRDLSLSVDSLPLSKTAYKAAIQKVEDQAASGSKL